MSSITPREIEESITTYIHANSGFERSRDYLSISHVSGCPRRSASEYLNGFTVDDHTHEMCFAGYEMEKSMLGILRHGILRDNIVLEVTAPFDVRLRGHVDAWTKDGDILEIKSVTVRKFEKVRSEKRPLFEHFVQVQLYMRYAKADTAFIVYRCRETYQHKAFKIPYMEHKAEMFEDKAKRILKAIDSGELPECECGRCTS